MKWSIKHLPKRTQEELNTLLELITHHVSWCSMVVLYGSYARGGYVLWDQKVEFGVNTSYQSDYDIMVVIAKSSVKHVEDRLRTKVTPKYHNAFAHRRHASPQFIVEYVDTLNKELERSQYFFTDIIKEGIKLYDTKEFKLAKPRELSFREIKEFAEFEFNIHYPDGEEFLVFGHIASERKAFKIGSFQLHQACERFYNAISLVYTNYRPKSHKLKELAAQVKEYSRELASVFPMNTDFEKRCYDLLCRAYIEARYNKDFVVTKEELAYMLERIEILKSIALRICTEKIASYEILIGEEEIRSQQNQ
jgi:uncharacterized protein